MSFLKLNNKYISLGGKKIVPSKNIPPADPTFYSLNQTNRFWSCIAAAPNGNVYAGNGSTGDIYMQTNGTGNFLPLGQTGRAWNGLTVAPNGNVYGVINTGDIYMQTNGTGNFNPLGQTSRAWRGVAAAQNGNIYACESTGDVYMQTNGTGTFNPLGQSIIQMRNIAVSPITNDVYVSTIGNGLWKQTNGTGNFIEQVNEFTNYENFFGITITQNNDMYIIISDIDSIVYDIYVQTNCTGLFNPLGQLNIQWRGLTTHPNGNIYASSTTATGNIYMQTN